MATKRIEGVPHGSDELDEIAGLLRRMNEFNEESAASITGEVEYWCDSLMGVVRHDGIWVYFPAIEVESTGGNDGKE